MAKQIGYLRHKSSLSSDKRIHFMSQIISGSMVVKMLSWETPFFYRIKSLRKQEEHYVLRRAVVMGANEALSTFMGPLAAFITVLVVWSQGKTLKMSGVFYAIVLLGIPRWSMTVLFARGMCSLTTEVFFHLCFSIRPLQIFYVFMQL